MSHYFKQYSQIDFTLNPKEKCIFIDRIENVQIMKKERFERKTFREKMKMKKENYKNKIK